jgi:hypothetical protein
MSDIIMTLTDIIGREDEDQKSPVKAPLGHGPGSAALTVTVVTVQRKSKDQQAS